MSEPDQVASCTYIWAISCILFICVLAGGGCLLCYIFVPEFQSSKLLPVLGFIFISTPWVFWILTAVYRLMSRAFGFRMVFGCLYGNNTAKVASVGDGDAAKDINDIGDAKIVDVNVKSLENEDDSVGQEKENNDKNEKALASSIAA
ncbi:hypothetical protein ERO13_D11G061300v2 [Gossypium hirsutum]|uniref:Uncharacterized protein n=2 Tax=Gossypium TaxID=3633 RepID=A0ABM3B3H1_GOSHI|nr:uncharacterized protein LOC121223667 [Gossypium hirsutum]KAG4119150.1 hypothetical protein ERO13_D11G061300v2 [Gossypium hirsutum]TYH42482.1 hypothetical protein ES332_D11G066200v1 [Gossypium tomentosum]